MQNLWVLLISYLIGSIPFSYMVARYWKGVDIRQLGSGNVGSTNVWRNAGPAAAMLAFAGDSGKGVLAVLLAKNIGDAFWVALAAVAVLVGHSWSIFLKFKGGKLVATGIGVLTAIAPAMGIAAIATWCLALFLTRYVSLASIITVACIPLLMLCFHLDPPYVAMGVFMAVFTVIKHVSNIRRLIAGTEPKVRN